MAALIQKLLSKLDPFKLEIYAGIALAIFIGSLMFIHHERSIGAQKLAAQIAVKEKYWQAKVDKVEADANRTIGELNEKLHTALATPPPNPVHVRVCGNPSGNARPVPSNPGPGPSGNAAVGPGATVAPAVEGSGVDIGPTTDELLGQLGARIEYLQGYVRACQKAGACAR